MGKRFHFVLKDRVLYAYKAAEDAMPFDTFPILGFTLETLSEKNIELYEGESGGLVFQLAHPGRETLIFVLITTTSVKNVWQLSMKLLKLITIKEEEIDNTLRHLLELPTCEFMLIFFYINLVIQN